MDNNRLKLEVSTWSIIKIILVLLGVYVLYLIRDVILLLFVVAILVAALRPIVNSWEKKIGRGLSIVSVFVIMAALVTGFIYIIIPPLIEQTGQLVSVLPDFIDRFAAIRTHVPALSSGIDALTNNIGGVTGGFVSITFGVIGGIANIITAIILTLYFLLDQRIFSRFLQSLIPARKKSEVANIVEKISDKIGDWLRGQLLLGLVIGVLTYIGLTIIQVPYALTLAVIAGVLEILPIIGPIVAGVIMALVALTVSPITLLFSIILAVVLQQLENNLLAPKIMQKAVGLPAVF